jgi:hypothetical protein
VTTFDEVRAAIVAAVQKAHELRLAVRHLRRVAAKRYPTMRDRAAYDYAAELLARHDLGVPAELKRASW